jgi:hypothetical protein
VFRSKDAILLAIRDKDFLEYEKFGSVSKIVGYEEF